MSSTLTSTRTETRVAALGAILTTVGFVLLPTLRTVVIAALGAEDVTYPAPSDAASNDWWGILGGVILLLIGFGILLQCAATAGSEHPIGRLTTLLGATAGASFALAGAGARTMYSFVAANLAETGADHGAQVAALWAVNIANSAFLLMGGVATAGWLVTLALHAPARGLVGRGAVIVAAVAGVIVAVAEIGFAFFAAQFLLVPAFAILAFSFWRRSRAVGQTASRG